MPCLRGGLDLFHGPVSCRLGADPVPNHEPADRNDVLRRGASGQTQTRLDPGSCHFVAAAIDDRRVIQNFAPVDQSDRRTEAGVLVRNRDDCAHHRVSRTRRDADVLARERVGPCDRRTEAGVLVRSRDARARRLVSQTRCDGDVLDRERVGAKLHYREMRKEMYDKWVKQMQSTDIQHKK